MLGPQFPSQNGGQKSSARKVLHFDPTYGRWIILHELLIQQIVGD
jgi:hypothetical protein